MKKETILVAHLENGFDYVFDERAERFMLRDQGGREEPCFSLVQARALAAGSRRAKTPQAVECEASQSGPAQQGNARKDHP